VSGIFLKKNRFKNSSNTNGDELGKEENIYYAFHLRNHYKTDTLELIEIFSRLEAWYSMAVAVKRYNLVFPEFMEQEEPYFDARGLFHVMLQKPLLMTLSCGQVKIFSFLPAPTWLAKAL
jgi:hypothetical protein